MDDMLRDLRYTRSPERRQATLENIISALDESQGTQLATGRPQVWRLTMNTRTGRLALAAAVILIVLGGVTFWPSSSGPNVPWWSGPPAALSAEVLGSMESAIGPLDSVRVLAFRERVAFVGKFGSTHISATQRRVYRGDGLRRMDRYYGDDRLDQTEWWISEGADLVYTSVSYEHQCYGTDRHKGQAYEQDPVAEHITSYVRLLDRADRLLEMREFEGRECVGFEIGADAYGDNPPERVDRIWFDIETRLPVRIEHHGRPVTDHPEQTFTHIQDQFEYHAEVPAEMFAPVIPEGFVDAHPDEIRRQRERLERGEMAVAGVPDGVKEDLVAALDQVTTVAYREGGSTRVYLSRYAWRRDRFEGDHLRTAEWFVIEKEDMAATSLDFNDEDFRLIHTVLDYDARTYRQVRHGRESRPRHPMDRIRSLVGYIDRADEILDHSVIDGIECFGFKLSAKKYGSNPDHMLHRLWFDVTTNLPVRMEFECVPESTGRRVLAVKDQFAWDPDVPADFWAPQIPPDFKLGEAAQN
jgi:hypothetical protein